MNDFLKISKLIEAYDLIEYCYKTIEEVCEEKVDIDTLTSAQVTIGELICDIIGTDNIESMFDKLDEIKSVSPIKAQQIINLFKKENKED